MSGAATPFDFDVAGPISDFSDAADRVVVRVGWHGAGKGPEGRGLMHLKREGLG
jgi:hypothetical protein